MSGFVGDGAGGSAAGDAQKAKRPEQLGAHFSTIASIPLPELMLEGIYKNLQLGTAQPSRPRS
jgi:hypothetical protein